MDFRALPPEINSARIYSGPGTGPLLTAAAAWDQLAREINASAAAYRSVIAGLTTDGWQGPSSLMMANAIAPYVAWMHSTAAEAEETAIGARAAAGAYQTAFALMVPPPLIAANRAQVMSLIASNFFGQNAPAIAATEAHYEQMWAQDSAAMYGYAGASAAASKLLPFADPPPIANPAGMAAQNAEVAQSAGSAAPQLGSQLPSAIQPLTAPSAAASSPSLLTYLLQIPSLTSAAASTSSSSFSGTSIGATNHAVAVNALRDDFQGIGPFLAGSTGPAALTSSPTVGAPPVSAAMGRASLVNTLSVPQTWAATPPVSPAVLPATAAAAPGALTTVPSGGMFGEALLGALAGRAVSNAAAKLRRPSVIPRSPAAG